MGFQVVLKQIPVTLQGKELGPATASEPRQQNLPKLRLAGHMNQPSALRAELGLHCPRGQLRRKERDIKGYFLKGPFPPAAPRCTQRHAPLQLLSALFPREEIQRLSRPSRERDHAMDHQYNHHQAGLGARCHLATAKCCLKTNLNCSQASPAPEEMIKSFCTNQHPPWDMQSHHAPTGKCCSNSICPASLQLLPKPFSKPKLCPAQRYPAQGPTCTITPHLTCYTPPTTKRNKQYSPLPTQKKSKTEAKGFLSYGKP